jgi:hypothetical protein
MERTTMSLKVSKSFLSEFRKFCEAHALSIGKFTEMQLTEVMEDYHFGLKAEQVLARGDSRRKSLSDLVRRSK